MKFNHSNIKKSKFFLDKGQCVAIPTETVYGLAANAYSDSAVKKIYKLKKRPKYNPSIVHYSNLEQLKNDCILNKNFFILKPFKISTGFLGLMTAINNPLFNPPYYVIGIGIDDSKYENKKSRIALRHNHLYADFKYLKKISKTNSIAEKIYFTDDNLNNKFNNLKK